MGIIWNDIYDLSLLSNQNKVIVVTSGGFDPLHVGHVRCIRESAKLGDILVVIVNGDGFLRRKKGFVFMPEKERMEIIANIEGVSHVVCWDDGSQFVDGALKIIKPNIFTKGGDRSFQENIAKEEIEICKILRCSIKYGVGGYDKIQSSSLLVDRVKNDISESPS